MKTRQLICALAVAAPLVVSAWNCGPRPGPGGPGEPGGGDQDAGQPPPPPPPTPTFASFVIDLVTTQTNETAAPADVSFDLADTEDPNAFDPLFQ